MAKCTAIVRIGKKDPEHAWARDLAAMIQVTLVAYFTGGAFLGLAYFDYLYHLMAVTVVLFEIVKKKTTVAVNDGSRPPSVTAHKPATAMGARG